MLRSEDKAQQTFAVKIPYKIESSTTISSLSTKEIMEFLHKAKLGSRELAYVTEAEKILEMDKEPDLTTRGELAEQLSKVINRLSEKRLECKRIIELYQKPTRGFSPLYNPTEGAEISILTLDREEPSYCSIEKDAENSITQPIMLVMRDSQREKTRMWYAMSEDIAKTLNFIEDNLVESIYANHPNGKPYVIPLHNSYHLTVNLDVCLYFYILYHEAFTRSGQQEEHKALLERLQEFMENLFLKQLGRILEAVNNHKSTLGYQSDNPLDLAKARSATELLFFLKKSSSIKCIYDLTQLIYPGLKVEFDNFFKQLEEIANAPLKEARALCDEIEWRKLYRM